MAHITPKILRFNILFLKQKTTIEIPLKDALDAYIRGYRLLQKGEEDEMVLMGQCAMTILGGILGEERIDLLLSLEQKEQEKEIKQLLDCFMSKCFRKTIRAVKQWENSYIKQYR